MMLKPRSSLAAYLTTLQSEGRLSFTSKEAIAALGLTEGAFLKAATRLQKQRMLLNPRQGFYVAVPPQFLSWGAPPPAWYIDALMRFEKRPYYVGLLKAAELHGAAHQAVMAFQVVTDKQLSPIKAGRSRISFHFRKNMDALSAGIIDQKTDTGSMKVSSPELTALDLLRYLHAAGGIDAVATVLSELSERIDPSMLAQLSAHFERSAVQRLGYLLERLGHADKTGPLQSQVRRRGSIPWVALEPEKRGQPKMEKPKPVERNEAWRVYVMRIPELDT